MKLTIENEKTGMKLEMVVDHNFNLSEIETALKLISGQEKEIKPLTKKTPEEWARIYQEIHNVTKDEMDLFEGGYRCKDQTEIPTVEEIVIKDKKKVYKTIVDCPICKKVNVVRNDKPLPSVHCPNCHSILFNKFTTGDPNVPNKNGFHYKANSLYNKK